METRVDVIDKSLTGRVDGEILRTSDNDILFWSHLGLGDQIGCNGIVHYLAEINPGKKIFVVTKESNMKNICYLYNEFDYIKPIMVPSCTLYERSSVNLLKEKMGLELVHTWISTVDRRYWDEDHFTNIDLNYDDIKIKYSKLPIIKHEDKILRDVVGDHKEFAFVHDDPSRVLTFNYDTNMPVVKNQPDLNVFEMIPILKAATELHMMGSALLCIAELLQLPYDNQKAFYYTFRGMNPIYNMDKWTLV
jgi:hypothetical protein